MNNFCTLSSSFEFLGKFILILFAIGFKLETILSGTIKVKKLFVIPVLSNASFITFPSPIKALLAILYSLPSISIFSLFLRIFFKVFSTSPKLDEINTSLLAKLTDFSPLKALISLYELILMAFVPL